MREILKLSHIDTETPANFKLRDFNLTVGSGEIIYLVANTDVEKYLIKDIITGRCGDYQGSLYYRNRKMHDWNGQKAYDMGVFYVDERHQLVSKFSVLENICVMKKTKPSELVIPMSQELEKTKRILELIGLQKKPGECVEHFSHFEKQLVCIAKMLYKGAELLIVDGMENKYSMREIIHMRNLLSVLKEMDLAVILLQRQPEELLSVSTKCVLMHMGSDAKILFPPQITKESISEYRLSNVSYPANQDLQEKEKKDKISTKFLVKDGAGTEERHRIIGYYDLGVDSKVHFKEYIQTLNDRAVQVTVNGCSLQEMAAREDEILNISSNSVSELMYHLDIGENLAFAFRFMEKRPRHLINRKFCSYLRIEFQRKFDIDPRKKRLQDLSYFEQKLLSIYRWMQVGHVGLIILEEPYLNLQGEEIDRMQQYLLEICRKYAPVALFSKNGQELMKTCNAILLSYNRRFIRYYKQEEFDKIIADTTRMIDQLV